ncbi:RING finger protein nhl-1 isoform X2 [Anopheles funestus]|uniref:RING finger protein nhl-1 isoform X2 n=1 Tax=Anopheles funestus TaxID=62324 RepID=UPI0020C62779|nr:RING finger protein nhl-1 isoform X2 [Anopheles funestus]
MEQFEQLLTCCVCLDRYRNPKLLPCQHSFCMEPCMDGLIDYVKRQVKCPECRAEHRIPYQGVQGFPTNVTLQRFLELHIEITGELPDPTSGQVMERCNVCSEKAYCALCVHCDKKICADCKGAHMDILRREISRINNQIRRGLHRLKEVLAVVEKNASNLQNNCTSVSEEIDEIYRRLQKALKDRTDHLRNDMDKYMSTELKNVVSLKENLELEIANIQSNADLAEKYMNDSVEWDDCELMDTKEIFLRTVDFIRNFDCETMDYSRKVRFIMNIDPNKLINEVSSYGDLNLPNHGGAATSQSQGMLQPPPGPGLMRSKSDHRLAAQFRQQQEAQPWNADEEPLLGGRKFGERPPKPVAQERDRYGGESRYGRGTTDYDYDDDTSSSRTGKGRFRSRFARSHQLDNDSDNESKTNTKSAAELEKERNKVTSTEDCAKGPLSGIFRLMDSPRVMKRLQDQEKGKKEKKASPAATPTLTKPSPLGVKPKTGPPTATARQLSEDDEIAKIKRQNKGASGSSTTTQTTGVTTPAAPEPERPTADRVSALKAGRTATPTSAGSDDSDSPTSPARRSSPHVEDTFHSFRYTSRFLNKSKSTAVVAPEDEATDDSDSRYGAGGRSRFTALQDRRNRLARSRSSHNFGNDDEEDEPVSPTTTSPSAYLASRYGASSSLASQPADLSRSRSTHALKSREPSPERNSTAAGGDKDGAALSSWARYLKNKYGNRTTKDGKDTPSSSSLSSSGVGSSSLSSPSSSSTSSASASAAARRLSLGLPLRQTDLLSSDDDSKNGVGSPTSPTAAAAVAGIPGAAGMSPRTQYLQKRRQLFQIGGRGSEPGSFTWPRGIAVGPDNSIVVADSSNHRVQVFDSNGIFVKEFGQYGNGDGEFDCLAGVAVNRIGQFIIADRYNHRIQVLDPAGRFLRSFGSQGTTDGKFNYPWGITTDALGFIYVCDKENHRIQVFQSDGSFIGKFGTCGKEKGQLEHPHYIAVSNTNRVIVSDSNNHRVQIFDVNGRVLTTFGGEGSEEGQFKFPRGVAVDDQGYICVADSGNNRIQIFHPDGSFLRAFGSWGSGDAEFKGLEGVAIMSNGNILVCDRENHRVQVF